MANNRLYLIDPATGDRFMLAKSFGRGWETRATDTLGARLASWLDGRDEASSFGNCFAMGATELVVVDENHDAYPEPASDRIEA